MRTKSSKYFEVKVKYDKMQPNGMTKATTEQYCVEALSFTECEKRITEEMADYSTGEFAVVGEKPASYREIFLTDMADDDKYFKVKLQYITIDEKTEKERKQNVLHLVQAKSLEDARKAIGEMMKESVCDYSIASIVETSILDVYEYHS